MAVKQKTEIIEPQIEVKKKSGSGVWVTMGWVFLLIGGLAHMLPAQMAPLLKLAVAGVNLQTAVGVLSVIVALYFLLGE